MIVLQPFTQYESLIVCSPYSFLSQVIWASTIISQNWPILLHLTWIAKHLLHLGTHLRHNSLCEDNKVIRKSFVQWGRLNFFNLGSEAQLGIFFCLVLGWPGPFFCLFLCLEQFEELSWDLFQAGYSFFRWPSRPQCKHSRLLATTTFLTT